MTDRQRLWLVAGLALALRLPRPLDRPGPVAWLYSAYPGPIADHLERGEWAQALSRYTGQHPPLWPLLHALTERTLPLPALWLGLSTLCSALAAWRWASTPGVGLLIATSPLLVAYSAELNNYPLLMLLLSLLWWLRAEVAAGRRSWGWLALVGALAGWTHALGGLSALVVALSLGLGLAPRLIGLWALCALPLIPGLLQLLQEGGATRQPPLRPWLSLSDYIDRYGALWLLLLPLLPRAWRERRAELCSGVVLLIAVFALVLAGVAAPHQFPYLMVPLWPLSAALGGAGRRGQRWMALVALLQALSLLRLEAASLPPLLRPAPSAVAQALSELQEPWTCQGAPDPTCTGDALYLLCATGSNDDDKRGSSPDFQALSPWDTAPRVRPYIEAWQDHRHGQPRLHRGFVVYVNDHLRPELDLALAAHRRMWIASCGLRHSSFTAMLQAHLRSPGEAVGSGRLFRPPPSPPP